MADFTRAASKSEADKTTTSIIIVTYGRPEYVSKCLNHLSGQTCKPTETIVVDASPDDLTRAVVASLPETIYLRNDKGYGHMTLSRNIGLGKASGEVVVFIDDDSYAHPDWLENLLTAYLEDPLVGAVGGRALNNQPDEESKGLHEIGRLKSDGTITGNFAANPGVPIEVDHIIGCNMSFRRNVLSQVGGFSGLYTGTELREETDLCLRIKKAGHKIIFTPGAVVEHVAAPYAHPKKWKRFDSRYAYFDRRNTACLLLSNFGIFQPIFWHYLLKSTLSSFVMFFGRIAKAFITFFAEIAGTLVGVLTGLKLTLCNHDRPQK